MNYDFWQTQNKQTLFPEIEWSKPERRDQAGKVLIIGGSTGNFRAVAASFETALKTGAGEAKVLMPDSLKKSLPPQITDVVFAPSNTSGGFSKEAKNDLKAASAWADSIVLIGDTNKNSETAILLEDFVLETQKPILIARDAVDLLMNSMAEITQRDNISIVASFAQTQKIFQTIFYPKILTFSMQLANLAEVLHKFTITYPVLLATYHNDNFIISENGQVISTSSTSEVANGKINPLKIWTGEIPTKIAIYQMWNRTLRLKAAASAIII